jgi:hypothetical protein
MPQRVKSMQTFSTATYSPATCALPIEKSWRVRLRKWGLPWRSDVLLLGDPVSFASEGTIPLHQRLVSLDPWMRLEHAAHCNVATVHEFQAQLLGAARHRYDAILLLLDTPALLPLGTNDPDAAAALDTLLAAAAAKADMVVVAPSPQLHEMEEGIAEVAFAVLAEKCATHQVECVDWRADLEEDPQVRPVGAKPAAIPVWRRVPELSTQLLRQTRLSQLLFG